jgi:uncharacterized protein YdhG (YjbR/CyaY superfamily)
MLLLWCGAAKHHCSFYPALSDRVAEGRAQSSDLRMRTIRFQPDKPLPATLVRKPVKPRIAKHAAGEAVLRRRSGCNLVTSTPSEARKARACETAQLGDDDA